jgi:hypothetical protein
MSDGGIPVAKSRSKSRWPAIYIYTGEGKTETLSKSMHDFELLPTLSIAMVSRKLTQIYSNTMEPTIATV